VSGQTWITSDHALGTVGFLVERVHTLRGWSETLLVPDPARGNLDHRPRLTGWCGTTNDVALYAGGVGRVVRVTQNHRAQVVTLHGDAERAALELLGYRDDLQARS
jgi:hypothetical protein